MELDRQLAEKVLALAVSAATLSSETEGDAGEVLCRLLEGADVAVVALAVGFLCRLLSEHMTPAEIRLSADRIIATIPDHG